ncbi:MAG: DMT family transporter [candidate division Zixibacteria bacterium]|nr:DMT family transporter [candidate division Zixibacteria bacterium]
MLTRLLLLFTVIVWGWTFVATKICLDFVNPVELLGLRLLLGLPVLFAVIVFKRVRFDFTRGEWARVLIGAAVITSHFLIQISGMQYTTATNTGWIISVTPLVMAALSFVFLKERLGRFQYAGIAVATCGILLLVSRGHLASFGWLKSTGDWLVLISAHTWAIYTVVTRDISRKKDPLAVTFAMLVPALVVTLCYIMFISDWSRIAQMSPRAVWALLFLAIPGMALGQWFWQVGVAKIGAARAGIYLYLEPVATTVLAIPLLHEPFGLPTALGGGLVLAGVWLGQRQKTG